MDFYQNFLTAEKKLTADAIKTASKQAIQKTAEIHKKYIKQTNT